MSKKTVIITGGAGFVGPYVARELRAAGYPIRLVMKKGKTSPYDGMESIEADLTDPKSAAAIVDGIESLAGVIHLAGFSHVGKSWTTAAATCEANIVATVNTFQACSPLADEETKFLFASSAEVYGKFDPVELPLSEFTPVNPTSPYGISKWTAEKCLMAMAHHSKMKVIIARCFNHIGPKQAQSFALPSFAAQIVAMERGLKTELIHGNLESRRDFLDVRDVARAYRLLLESGKTGEKYVISSGQSHSIRSVVEKMFAIAGVEPAMRADAELYRVVDIMELCGNPEKLIRDTGWSAKIPLETTLADVLADARSRAGE